MATRNDELNSCNSLLYPDTWKLVSFRVTGGNRTGLAGVMAVSPPFFSIFESFPRHAMLRGRVLPGGMTGRASSPATTSYLHRFQCQVAGHHDKIKAVLCQVYLPKGPFSARKGCSSTSFRCENSLKKNEHPEISCSFDGSVVTSLCSSRSRGLPENIAQL